MRPGVREIRNNSQLSFTSSNLGIHNQMSNKKQTGGNVNMQVNKKRNAAGSLQQSAIHGNSGSFDFNGVVNPNATMLNQNGSISVLGVNESFYL